MQASQNKNHAQLKLTKLDECKVVWMGEKKKWTNDDEVPFPL